jgi:hypothetical protein
MRFSRRFLSHGPTIPSAAVDCSLSSTSQRVAIGGHLYSSSWLRDHCKCAVCVDPASKQKLHASSTMWPAPRALDVQEEGGQFATVTWADGALLCLLDGVL